MLKRLLLTTSCAAALASGPATAASSAPPETALKSAGSVGATKVEADSPVVAIEGVAAVAAEASEKKGGNPFLRALSAPFRALAKLFSGKGKAKGSSAKSDKRAAPASPSQSADARTGAGADAPATGASPSNLAAAGQAARPPAQVQTSPATPVEAPKPFAGELRARVESRTPAAPGGWKPFIEGVPRDHLSQGRALMQAGYYGEAIAELSVAATVGPDLLEAHRLLGQTYDRLGAHAQAREHYGRALSFAPRDPRVLHSLGHSLYLDNQFGEALKRLKEAARVAPNDAPIAHSTGLVQFRLHKFDDALKSFRRAEGEYAARLRLGEMLEQSGFDARAAKQYEVAIKLQPSSVIALERLAGIYQRTGRQREAEAVRQTIKNIHAGGGG